MELAERLFNRSRSARGDFGDDTEEGLFDKMDRLRRSFDEPPGLPEGRTTVVKTNATTSATPEQGVVAIGEERGAAAGQLPPLPPRVEGRVAVVGQPPPLPPCDENAANGDHQGQYTPRQNRR